MKKIAFIFLCALLFSTDNNAFFDIFFPIKNPKWGISLMCVGLGFLYYHTKVNQLTKDKETLDGTLHDQIDKNLEWEQLHSKLLGRLRKSNVVATRTGSDYIITNNWQLLHKLLLHNLAERSITTLWVEDENTWYITCEQEEELLQQIHELSQELALWRQRAHKEKKYVLLHKLWNVTRSLELEPECRQNYSEQEIYEIMQRMRFKPKPILPGIPSQKTFIKDSTAHPFPMITVPQSEPMPLLAADQRLELSHSIKFSGNSSLTQHYCDHLSKRSTL